MVVSSSCVLALLTGCAGAPDASPGGSSPATSVTSTTSSPPAAAPVLPDGNRWRTVAKVHTTFAAPASWTALDPAKLSTLSADSPELKSLADKLGVSPAQVSQFLSHVDLYLAGPPVKGYAPNIQAVVLPMAELPSEAALTAQLSQLSGGEPPSIAALHSPVGEGTSAAFTMDVTGRTIYVRSLYFDTPDGILNLTVGAPDEVSAIHLAATLTETAHRT